MLHHLGHDAASGGHDGEGAGIQREVQLAAAQPAVERVLQRTGLDRLFVSHPDRATGIANFELVGPSRGSLAGGSPRRDGRGRGRRRRRADAGTTRT